MTRTLALSAVTSVSREVIEPDLFGGDVLHYSIPALQETGSPISEPATDILSAKLRLHGGEVLISKLNPRKNLVVEVPEHLTRPALASTEFVVLRPLAIHRRYLLYLLQSETTRQWLDSNVRSVTRSHQRVEPEFITHLQIALPSNEEQQRIADFLDDQVARIDDIIAARCAQARLVDGHMRSQLQERFDAVSKGTRPLSTLTDPRRPIQYGIVLPGPDVLGGVPIVKGGDIASGRLRRGDLNRTDPAIEAKYTRSRLIAGDLVIAIRGSVGEVDAVPPGLSGANLTQDAARIAAWDCDHEWLRGALDLPSVQSDIRRRITGAMVPGINIEALRRVRVPNTPSVKQGALGDAARQCATAARDHIDGLDASVRTLEEFKRSLITAAVTGEFDVSSASGRQGE